MSVCHACLTVLVDLLAAPFPPSWLVDQVAKVELKDDASINHDRFVHDVDKGTVTGTVFREMDIPDDPLDDDVEVFKPLP